MSGRADGGCGTRSIYLTLSGVSEEGRGDTAGATNLVLTGYLIALDLARSV